MATIPHLSSLVQLEDDGAIFLQHSCKCDHFPGLVWSVRRHPPIPSGALTAVFMHATTSRPMGSYHEVVAVSG